MHPSPKKYLALGKLNAKKLIVITNANNKINELLNMNKGVIIEIIVILDNPFKPSIIFNPFIIATSAMEKKIILKTS